MIDVLARALRHPVDYSSVFKIRTITFRERIEEIPGTYSFLFETKKPISWKAGQHAVFSIPGRNIDGKTWRPFSVASSPHEGVVRLGTNVPEPHSDFKEKLMQLKPGDTIRIFGPHGEFHASGSEQHIIGIAGGIGITPFRALAYDIAHGHLPHTKLTLIYTAREHYAYKTDLDLWQGKTEQLSIIYLTSPEEVQIALAEQFAAHQNNADYFISGSPRMIDALYADCKKMGVHEILHDPFKGY